MVTTQLKWIVQERQVYNVDTEEVEILEFLRMGHIDNYNNTMGHVDVADQLRGSYRLDAKVRNIKWWWSPMFWAVGVQITNAYVSYKSLCKQYGIEKSLSHLEFRERLAMAWVNMPEYLERYGVAKPRTANTPPPRQIAFSPISLASALGSPGDSTTEGSRSVAVKDATLDPVQGALKIRLDTSYSHLHVPKTNSTARCGLHRWCTEEQHYSNVVYCPTCKVHLCHHCYKPFHTLFNIVSEKKALKDELKKRK